MGIVFGSTGTAEPSFNLLAPALGGNANMQIRAYQAYCTASVKMKSDGTSSAFRELASYIGVTGPPANRGIKRVFFSFFLNCFRFFWFFFNFFT